MAFGFSKIYSPQNEPVLTYAQGTEERTKLKQELSRRKSVEIDIPMIIDGKEIRTGNKKSIHPPHEHQHVLGYYHKGSKEHVQLAIDAALKAKKAWENTTWENRAAIFLRAADLISTKYRASINAATMLGQSKSAYQAEIDSACELADFLRFNVYYMTQIYSDQPINSPGVWNRVEYRPLEGFIFALTPFNFTAIAGNLGSAPAMLGNVVVWKPSEDQIYSAQVIMQIFLEAGLPDGVINLVFASGPDVGEVVFQHPDFAGLHFTGSTGVFQHFWNTIGQNIHKYKSYPRIVGETGGKDFILAHPSATANEVATAIIRGAFEYQGQKCSAASRVYLPSNLWSEIERLITKDSKKIKMGSTEDFSCFFNAVINEKSFDKLASYIDKAKKDAEASIVFGGNYDKSVGYFIEPTVIRTTDPYYITMVEELFGPIVTIYVYDEHDFDGVLKIVDNTSGYALTGAVFSNDRYALARAIEELRHAAGNFYINDKPTGAVVGNQPFGGGRASGTNDKAGSLWNLIRWVSPRTIKENMLPPTNFGYPFMTED